MSSPSLPPTAGAVLLAPSPAAKKYDFMYYLKGAAAGGICCSITHGALTPVDVVKTRVQLDPVKVRNILKKVDGEHTICFPSSNFQPRKQERLVRFAGEKDFGFSKLIFLSLTPSFFIFCYVTSLAMIGKNKIKLHNEQSI